MLTLAQTSAPAPTRRKQPAPKLTREERARQEYHLYVFRKSAIAGHPVVFVHNSEGGAIYTVSPKLRKCNCPDFIERCEGTIQRCKHVLMVQRFLFEQSTVPVPQPAPAPAAPALDPVELARIAREYIALWDATEREAEEHAVRRLTLAQKAVAA